MGPRSHTKTVNENSGAERRREIPYLQRDATASRRHTCEPGTSNRADRWVTTLLLTHLNLNHVVNKCYRNNNVEKSIIYILLPFSRLLIK